MDAAAWQYGQKLQILLDGTFGICSTCILLFIAMGIDEHGKGVPIAFFMFSALTGSHATHAGYNMAILHKLLDLWKCHLDAKSQTLFTLFVAITDTDIKEWAALLDVWPNHHITFNSLLSGNSAAAATGGIKHLDYLLSYWMPLNM
ncbi:hypothetical protein C0995_016356 [Termitomyces sp. Mi166|nr:hypothetical protein C0995_016356 [Termitomyces sp. Mi166\